MLLVGPPLGISESASATELWQKWNAFHLCETSRISMSLRTERSVVSRGRGKGGVLAGGCRGSPGVMECSKIDCGDGCTIL